MKTRLLLKTLLVSTSEINILKYETDRKKRNTVIGGLVGKIVLYLFLMAYLVATAYGYGIMGFASQLPLFNVIIISVMVFIFAIMKVNGYLFAFQDYDMIMSLPFSVKTIVSSKFLYMYVKDLPWMMSISLALMAGYGIFEKPFFTTYILWILLSLVLPVLPLIAATILGTLFAAVGSRFKFKKAIQSILIFTFIILCFFSRFFIENLFKNNSVEGVLSNTVSALDSVKSSYPPAAWFCDAILNNDIWSIVLLVLVSFVLFEITFLVISRFYRQVNSGLMANSNTKKYTMTHLKTRRVELSIAICEFKRFLHSTTYLTNMGFGVVMIAFLSVAILFVDVDHALSAMTGGAPFTKEMLLPAIPLFIYFFVGMVSTCCSTPSLEGKSNWILQSLPLENKTIYRGKMLFNMLLYTPVGIMGCICFGVKCGGNLLCVLTFILCEIALCAFSTTWGMICGVKFKKLDWTNEIEVVKQGSALTIYLFPNLFGTMLLIVGAVILGQMMSPIFINLILTAVFAALSLLCYHKVVKM